MVTTIKITCDGVFIQSNSFLTREHHHRSSSVPATTTQHHLERSLRQSHQPKVLNGHHNNSESTSPNSSGSGSDNSIVSCERAGHDKKFTISFLNSRQPVPRNAVTSDINNNSKNCGGGVKINDYYNKNSVKSYNNNTKRQLGVSLSASPITSNKSSSTSVAPTKVVQNIG